MHSLSKRKLAILALITANIIWGASFPIYKWALSDVPPFTFVFLRFSIGAVFLFPFAYRKLRIKPYDISRLISYSLSGITLTISFLFLGLKLAPSINAPIILSTSPILLIIFSIFFLRNKPQKKVIIGTCICLMGIIITVFRPILESGFNMSVLGNIFFMLSAIADVTSIILLEKMMRGYPTLTIVFWSFLIGSFPLIPFVVLEQRQFNFISTLNYQGLIGIGYGSLIAAAIAHSLNAFGARYIHASEIGIFAYVDPIATALVAVPLLGEKITFFYLLGTAFVFVGLLIAERKFHHHKFHMLSNKMNE